MSKTPIFMRKGLRGWTPADSNSEERLKRFKTGNVYRVDVCNPRSLPWHRRYFALCSLIADNRDDKTHNEIHQELKLCCGCKILIKTKNADYWVPDSIAFDCMDGVAWVEYWDRVVKYVASDLLPGVKREDLEAEIADITGIYGGK